MEIEEFKCFININRELLDLLYEKSPTAINSLKNAVIGSDRQKAKILPHVPKLLDIVNEPNLDLNVRLDAAIIIGN